MCAESVVLASADFRTFSNMFAFCCTFLQIAAFFRTFLHIGNCTIQFYARIFLSFSVMPDVQNRMWHAGEFVDDADTAEWVDRQRPSSNPGNWYGTSQRQSKQENDCGAQGWQACGFARVIQFFGGVSWYRVECFYA